MSKSSLKLFNAVPASYNRTGDFRFIPQYGVAVDPSATHELNTIYKYLEEQEVSGQQINHSFHKSWHKVAAASRQQLVTEQVLHYLTTYGFLNAVLYSDDSVYIPPEYLDVPFPLVLRVIKGVSQNDLRDRSLELLQSGTALDQETIEDLLAVLDECGYRFTGNENIQNKEAQAIIADRTGVLPSGEDLLRYLVYRATGSTLLIKNRDTFQAIRDSRVILPQLKTSDLISLAESFNRYKPIWLSFKKINPINARVVNKLNKLSKNYHRPLPKDVILNLTNTEYSQFELRQAMALASTTKIIRALNAVRYYRQEPENRFYKIRNGKGWAQRRPTPYKIRRMFEIYEYDLLMALRERVTSSGVYVPEHIDYAVPTTQKQYVGNIPAGTKIAVPYGSDHFLVGIYWEGSMVDLDLRADSSAGSVGWNSRIRTPNRCLMHSGDITSAPQGAAEWLYAQSINETYLVKVNLYSGPLNHPFKIVVGHGSGIQKNYMVDPNKVLFQADGSMVQREITIGVLEPTKYGVNFYLCGQGSGEKQVGGRGKMNDVVRSSLISQYRTQLRLSEIMPVDNPLTPDLSPDKLRKDSISQLIAG